MASKVTMADLIAAQTIDSINGRAFANDDGLLRDLAAEHPAVRLHLLGGKHGEMIAPSGTLMLKRKTHDLELRLHKPMFGYQTTFRGDSFFGLLELAEQALASGGDVWEPDWAEQQKDKRELAHKLKGS